MNIKEARQFAGLSRKEVRDLTGIPERSLQNWEEGTRQPPEYVEEYLIKKLCQVKQVARVTVTKERVTIETIMDDDFEFYAGAPIFDGRITVDLLITIGQLTEAGYKIIYK